MVTPDHDIETPLRESIATALACERVFAIHAKPNPLQPENLVQSIAREGTSLAEIVEGLEPSLIEITVNGVVVPCEYWPRLKPKAGATVNVRTFPQGKTVRKIVAVVVIVAVMWLTSGAATGFWASMGVSGAGLTFAHLAVSLIGMLAMQALVKPTVPKMSASNGDTSSNDRENSITGTSNSFNPYGVQPIVIGETRFFPPQCAMPYTELSGEDQYLRMLLDIGPGDVAVDQIAIGEDDIETFNDVEVQLGPDPQLYSNDVFQLSVAANLPNDGAVSPPKTSTLIADEIKVEVAWPQGLYGAKQDGTDVQVTMQFDVQYRNTAGTTEGQPLGTWVSMQTAIISHAAVTPTGGHFQCASSARKQIRCEFRKKVPRGQYEVQVTRISTNWNGADPKAQIGDFGWVTLTSVHYINPCKLVSTKLGVRIKATDQLNGSISTLNCHVRQNIKYWAGTDWGYGPSNNPAWIYLWLLTVCPANPRLMDESRVDIDELKAWAADCDTWGFQYASVADNQTTLLELIQDVCAAGKASFTMKNGLYSVVRDIQQTVPVQVFTPRTSWEFSGSRTFTDEVHALRCSFVNTQANWQKDERIVYQTGFDATNATKFENFDVRGSITPESVWRLGSYHLSVAINRQNVYALKCDFESLVCTRGDLILVSHPTCNWGSGWGRINTFNATPATTITLDEDVPLVPFKDNVVRIRNSAGVIGLSSVRCSNLIYHNDITYSRNSEASFRGFDGLLTYAEVDQPRYAYGPAAEELGVLIEEASTNLLTWSELLSDSSWTVGANATLDYTGSVAPDGTSMAMRLIPDTSTAQHAIAKFATGTFTTGPVTLSVFAKNFGNQYLRLHLDGGTSSVDQVFNTFTGLAGVSAQTGSQLTLTNVVCEPWNDSWVRVSISVNCNFATATAIKCAFYVMGGNNLTIWAGTGDKGLLLWGAQFEQKAWASSYISTGGATKTRAVDAATVPSTAASGSFITEFTPLKLPTSSTSYAIAWSLNDTTNAERYHLSYRMATTNVEFGVVDNNVSQAVLAVDGSTATTYRAVVSLTTNQFRMSVNGSAIVTDTVGTVPTVTRIQFGSLNSQWFLNGYLRQLQFIPGILNDNQLTTYSVPGYPITEDDLVLVTPLTVGEGDLAMVGVRNEESARMVVTKIEPSSDLTATITCVDEAPDVYTAGTGTPPGFISTITNQPWCPAPPPPLLTGAVTTGTGPGTGQTGNDGGPGAGTGGAGYGGNNTGGVSTPGIQVAMSAQAWTSASAPSGSGTTDTDGTSAGHSTVTGIATRKVGATSTIAGTSTVNGQGNKRFAAVGTSAGISAATGVSGAKAAATGISTGTSEALMPSGILPTPTAGVVVAGATVNGVSGKVATTDGLSTFSLATALGDSGSTQSTSGTSANLATVLGNAMDAQPVVTIVETSGTSVCIATVTANAAKKVSTSGFTVVIATVSGVSGKRAGVVGTVTGTVNALGASDSLGLTPLSNELGQQLSNNLSQTLEGYTGYTGATIIAVDGSVAGTSAVTGGSDYTTGTGRGPELSPGFGLGATWVSTNPSTVSQDSAHNWLVFTAAATGDSIYFAPLGLTDNTTYEVIYSFTRSGGLVRAQLSGPTTNHVDPGTSWLNSGTYSELLTTTGTGTTLNEIRFTAMGGGTTNSFTITSLSIKKVTSTSGTTIETTGTVAGVNVSSGLSARKLTTRGVAAGTVTVNGQSSFSTASGTPIEATGSSTGASTVSGYSNYATPTRGFDLAGPQWLPDFGISSSVTDSGILLDSTGATWQVAANLDSVEKNNVSELVSSNTYELIYTVTNYTSGSFHVRLYAESLLTVAAPDHSASGTYTEQVTFGSGTGSFSNQIRIQATGPAVGGVSQNSFKFTALSVRQVISGGGGGGGGGTDPGPSGIQTGLLDGATGPQFNNESGTPLTGDMT